MKNADLLKEHKTVMVQYHSFMHSIVRRIHENLENKVSEILQEIFDLDKRNRENQNLSEDFFNLAKENEDEEKLTLDLVQKLDDHFQQIITENKDLNKIKYIQEHYRKDVYLMLNRLKSHLTAADEGYSKLIDKFQFADRVRQQMEHLRLMMESVLESMNELDYDDEEKMKEFVQGREKWLEEIQSMLSTSEEREALSEIFGIIVKEVSEDEIFDMF